MLENVFKFYSTEALKQFYKIVGALDIVGNPTMLVTSLVTGIRDFVLTPSAALMNSPRDPSRLGIGVAQVCIPNYLKLCIQPVVLTILFLKNRVHCRSYHMVQVAFLGTRRRSPQQLVKVLHLFHWTTNFVTGITTKLWFRQQI